MVKKKDATLINHALQIPRERFQRLTALKAEMGVRTWDEFYERLVDLYEHHQITLDGKSGRR